MLKNDNIAPEYFPNKKEIIFSFGKSDKTNENSNNKKNANPMNNENTNNNKVINDRETHDNKIQKCISIYKLLNKNKVQAKETTLPLLNINNINQAANNITKPKIEINKDDYISPKKNLNKVIHYSILENKEKKISKCSNKSNELFQNSYTSSNIISNNKKEIMEIFDIKDENEIPFEISYLLSSPCFLYDFEHQNDNNSNYQYVNENFIDILLRSYNL